LVVKGDVRAVHTAALLKCASVVETTAADTKRRPRPLYRWTRHAPIGILEQETSKFHRFRALTLYVANNSHRVLDAHACRAADGRQRANAMQG
jgi:hypothetical protein